MTKITLDGKSYDYMGEVDEEDRPLGYGRIISLDSVQRGTWVNG